MTNRISKAQVREILAECGWSETRSFDVQELIVPLEDRGIRLSYSAKEVLTQLGGLTIRPPERDGTVSPQAEVVKFNPTGMTRESLAFWQEKAGCLLSPLGEIDQQADFCIADNGNCYVGFSLLWKIGADIDEALAALFLGDRKWVEIWRPHTSV